MSNETPETAPPDPKRKRILLIEDEPIARLQILQKLRDTGFDVDVASNGQVALERMRALSPDAIFMDLLLPDVKGVDVIKAARNDPKFGNRPIYVFTSAALIDAWTRRATKAGATKVFNRAVTTMDTIAVQLAVEMGIVAAPPAAVAAPPSPPPVVKRSDSPPRVANPPAGAPMGAPRTADEKGTAATAKGSSRGTPLLKRVLYSFRRSAAPDSVPSPAPEATSPPPPPPVIRPVPAEASGPVAEPPPVPAAQSPVGASALPIVAADPAPSVPDTFNPFEAAASPAGDLAAIVSFDENGTIVSANQACGAMFGWEATPLVGEGLSALLRPGTDQDVRRFILERLQGGSHERGKSLNVIARRKDGREFPASVTTLIWSTETRMTRKSDNSLGSLTAIFRAQSANPAEFAQSVRMTSPVAAMGMESTRPSRESGDDTRYRLKVLCSEAAALRETLLHREQENQDVMGRVTAYETELKEAQAALELEREERQKTEARCLEVSALLLELEKRSHAQVSENRESIDCAGKLADELGEARTALVRADEVLAERNTRCSELESELSTMRQEVESLNTRLASQPPPPPVASEERTQELEERLRSVLDNLENMRSDPNAQSELHREVEIELSAAKVAAEQAETCLQKEVERSQSFEGRLDVLCSNLRKEQSERSKRFEEELGRHREEREALNRELAAQQEKADESQRHAQDLEQHLTENAANLERVREELEQRKDEQRRSEFEWRQKLENADSQAKALTEALRQAEARAKEFQQEMTVLQQDRADLTQRLSAEQQAAAEIKFRVDDLEERLRQNAAELEKLKSARENAVGQKSSEMDEANLYHMRDLLGSKLEIEQRVAAESNQRSQALEEQLQQNAAELERVKAELNQHSSDQVALENKLQSQLNAARSASEQAEASLKTKHAECGQLQSDLADLQQVRDDLRNKLTLVQQSADNARQTSEQFERQLHECTDELERVKAEQLRQTDEQKKIEEELQSQLAAAKAATERAVTACNEEAERNRAFEERLRILGNSLKQEELQRTRRMEAELVNLRQACGKLTENLTTEKEASAAARQHGEQLEQQLKVKTQELERLTAEQTRQAQERQKLETELKEAKAAGEKSEAAHKEKSGAFGQLQSELQQVRIDLENKLAAEKQAAASARRQGEQLEEQLKVKTQELERLTAEQTRQAQEHQKVETELKVAKAAGEKSEAAHKEKSGAFGQLQTELQQVRTDLGNKLTTEKQASAAARQNSEQLAQQLKAKTQELEQLTAEQARQAEARQRLETELKAAKDAMERSETGQKEKAGQFGRLQTELQQARADLGDKLKAATQEATTAKQQNEQLKQRLRTSTAEVDQIRADHARLSEDRSRLESELQRVLAAAEKSEREIAQVRNELQASEARFTTQQQALAKSKRQGKEVEKQTKEFEKQKQTLEGELARLQAECAAARREVAESREKHALLETRLRESSENMKKVQEDPAVRERFESENQRLTESVATLTAELCRFREGTGTVEAQLIEAQRQVQDSVARASRATADFEKERGERRRAEHRVDSLTEQLQELHGQIKVHLDAEMANKNRMSDLEQHLRQNEDHLTRANDDLQKERTDRQLVEQQLKAADALSKQLRNCLTSFDLAKEGFKRAQGQMETKLQASWNALKECETKLQQEMSQRLRHEEALAQAQRGLQEKSQGTTAEVDKLKLELEEERAERKKVEGDIAQSRYASLDSARAGLAMVNRLRSQVREPVDGLMQSTRRLLEAELEDEVKKQVELLLENALTIQRTLQEAATLTACTTRAQDLKPGEPEGSRSAGSVPKQTGEKLQP